MKKMITFVLMALLIGGFAYNANAQVTPKKQQQTAEKGTVKSDEAQVSSQNASKEDINKTLTDYEQAVDKCYSIYQKMHNNTSKEKDYTKEFTNSLAQAEKLKNQLEKYRPQMNRTQINRLNKANEKLSKVMIK